MRFPSFQLDGMYVVALAVLALSGSIFAIEQYAGVSIAGEAAPMYGTMPDHKAAPKKPGLNMRAESGAVKEMRKDVRDLKKEIKRDVKDLKETKREIKREVKKEKIERTIERKIERKEARPPLRCILKKVRMSDPACELKRPRSGSGAMNASSSAESGTGTTN